MAEVTYEGPSSRSDSSTAFRIDGVEFQKGRPQEVEGDLLKELSEGSARTKGHKFSVGGSTLASDEPPAVDDTPTTTPKTPGKGR